jgi:hypothetical protein
LPRAAGRSNRSAVGFLAVLAMVYFVFRAALANQQHYATEMAGSGL